MINYNYEGDFTKNLLCLKLQLETLFEEAGGEKSLKFLDLVSALSKKEQEVFLTSVNNILIKILNETNREKSEEDIVNESFENDLYNRINEDLEKLKNLRLEEGIASRFKVIDGGKTRARRKIISFNKYA